MSLRQICMQAGGRQISKTFWRRLTWRDLAYWQLHHFPDMSTQPIRSHYADQVSPRIVRQIYMPGMPDRTPLQACAWQLHPVYQKLWAGCAVMVQRGVLGSDS